MANVLFQHQNQKNNSILDLVNQAKAMGPSAIVAQQLYNSNPKFKQLADSVQGMTPEQAFSQYGLDFNLVRIRTLVSRPLSPSSISRISMPSAARTNSSVNSSPWQTWLHLRLLRPLRLLTRLSLLLLLRRGDALWWTRFIPSKTVFLNS